MKPFGGADLGRRDAQVTADQCGIRSFCLSDQLLPLDGLSDGLTHDSRRMSSQGRLFCEAQASLRSLDPRRLPQRAAPHCQGRLHRP